MTLGRPVLVQGTDNCTCSVSEVSPRCSSSVLKTRLMHLVF